GYVSLTMDEIPLAKLERPENVPFSRLPALKIAQMGIHVEYAGNKLGQELVTFAILIASHVKQEVGCRYVTLDAKTDLVKWYLGQGFELNEKDNEERAAQLAATKMSDAKRQKREAELPVSMRFDLMSGLQ
ncbi:MAG: hypothetical protein ACRDHZ_19290, partial [Ktedonobacteraceae bacterium]